MKTPMTKPMLAAFAATLLCLGARAANEDKTWMVVDLRTGALSYYGYDLTTATNTFNTAEYKTEKMVFRRIPAGLYWAQDGEARAIMQNDYYMAIFPTTVGQYAIINNKEVVVDPNDEQNLHPKRDLSWENLILSSNSPVSKLGQLVYSYGETTSLSFMVPTVAMWEVATRAMPANDDSHKTWRWFFADSYDDIAQYAWLNNMLRWDTRPVGSYLPNDWGLYDVYGNCREWCKDTYSLYVQPVSEWWAESIPDIPSMVGYDSYSQQTAVDYRFYNGTEVVERDVRCCCGYYEYVDGPISSSSVLGVKQTEDGGVRIAIICTNECSAPPVTITWQDHSGNVLEVDTVPLGSAVSYDGPQPTRADDEEGYDYFFHRWEPYVGMAVTNTTFTPSFFFTARPYTIHWLNYDGVELCSSIVGYGSTPAYADATPTKPPTVEYEYTFTGWNPEPAAVTGETTYVAQFMQSARKYDITWLNYDGSTNATSRTPYNTTPEFEGETPAKPSTVQYAYTFAGWTPELEPATSNAAYTAVFDESIREYPVNFYNNTGSELLFTTNVPYGSTPEYLGESPTNPSTAQYHYSFAGWGRDMRVVDGPSFYNDYYAEFDPILRSYDITWVNYDGTVLCVTNVPYGTTPAYTGATPTKPATDTTRFIFSGWTQAVVPVTGATTYTAKFDEYVFLINLSTLTAAYTAIDGDILTNATGFGVSIADGATVTLSGMSSKGMTCLGNATIIIADDTENTLSKTLSIGGSGTSLVIEGSTGKLTVNGSIYTPAIGKGGSDSGDIVVNGGTIEANGTYQASGIGCAGDITINGGNITATGHEAPGIGMRRGGSQNCGNITISGGIVNAVGTCSSTWNGVYDYNLFAIGGYCGEIRIESTITKVVATIKGGYPIGTVDSPVIIAEGLKQTEDGSTLTIEPHVKETAVTVGGVAVGEVVRGEDGKTLSFAVAAGTVAGDVKLDIGGVDVTKGFRVTVDGTEASAVLLAPYEVPKEAGAADGIWTENGDGTVTLNITVVPGLYYAADSAESLDALACPGASAPATGATTLTAPKPGDGKGFFKIWVSDAPFPEE